MLPAGTVVCVTGASGFIATELVSTLLARGLVVRGTVRSKAKAAHLFSLPGAASNLTLFEAELLGDGTAFDAAFAGCSVVFHTACPFVVTARAAPLGEEFFVAPAVKGTEAVLAACGRTEGLKRVVLTSSCAAIFKRLVPADHVYNEVRGGCRRAPPPPRRRALSFHPPAASPSPLPQDTWNDPEELATRKMWYSIGKTAQERAAWAWMEAHKPGFDLVAINPCMVAGSAKQPTLNASLENVLDLCNGSKDKVPNFKCVALQCT